MDGSEKLQCNKTRSYTLAVTATAKENYNELIEVWILTSSIMGLYTTPTVGTFPIVRPMETQTKGNL